jgi:hypothetical protein
MNPPKPSRVRRVTKWACASASVVVFVLWLASTVWWIAFEFFIPEGKGSAQEGPFSLFDCKASIQDGILYLDLQSVPLPMNLCDKVSGPHVVLRNGNRSAERSAPIKWRHRLGCRLPDMLAWKRLRFGTLRVLYLELPLWMPFLLFATLAAIWLVRDRRIPLGHCEQCGYNLTANVSGICPECGAPIAPTGTSAGGVPGSSVGKADH